MEPFAQFLIAMGYPAATGSAFRGDADHSTSSFMDSRQLAGMLAWFYENEGMLPLLIGHSQGGMLAIRVLYDLAGAFGANPGVESAHRARPKTALTIVDPQTGELGPWSGCECRYAAAIATGKLPRLMPRSVVDALEAAQHPRQRRRIHRLLDRMGLDRRATLAASSHTSQRARQRCAT